MSVKEGDIVEVLQFEDETEQEGWWMVKCANGKQGLVPDNFVELIQNAPGKEKVHTHTCVCLYRIIYLFKCEWRYKLMLSVATVHEYWLMTQRVTKLHTVPV